MHRVANTLIDKKELWTLKYDITEDNEIEIHSLNKSSNKEQADKLPHCSLIEYDPNCNRVVVGVVVSNNGEPKQFNVANPQHIFSYN